ncbi:MAG: translesion error-prone DNA polymerase V autoproteolytic subunit [Bacteroidales bacterium]|nr:translesion error-prone DNA polymerase V autoproteolytic subunit [Bacteroidales bacterium]
MPSQKKKSSALEFFIPDTSVSLDLPLLVQAVSAGFPSPAEDYTDNVIDLNKELIRHPYATFLARVKGLSMKDAGIEPGDILVIDKSLDPADGKIAVCFIDGEFVLKRIKIEKDCAWLMPANEKFKPLRITEDNNFQVWGIVTYVIKKM